METIGNNINNISVVITCYREGKLIIEAVNSVVNQSLRPLEILIVNDASTDPSTIAVCQELEQNPLIKVIWRTKNGGTSVAREDGFRTAQGEILVPLDADDILPEKALQSIAQAFIDHPSAGFVYGKYVRLDRVDSAASVVDPGDISLLSMLRSRPFSLSTNWRLIGTTPLKRSLWVAINGYDPSFGVNDLHDVEFWIRAIASGCSYYAIPEVIYIWRKYLGTNSKKVTPTAWARIAQKYYDIYTENNLEYRALELLLLGSKWENRPQEIQNYQSKLWKSLWQGQFQVSTLFALMIPAALLRSLAQRLSRRR